MSERAYVVAVQPNADYRVRDELVRLGYDVWLPECVHRRKVRRSGPVLSVEGPLYPGYQFVSFDSAECAWRDLEAVRGVHGLLLRDGRPAAVPEAEMDWLRRVYGGAPFIVICGHQVWREFEPGQRVRIEEGVFAGYDGLFAERRGGEAQIRLDIFNRFTDTTIPIDALVPLPA